MNKPRELPRHRGRCRQARDRQRLSGCRTRTNRHTCTWPAKPPTSTTCPSSPARCTAALGLSPVAQRPAEARRRSTRSRALPGVVDVLRRARHPGPQRLRTDRARRPDPVPTATVRYLGQPVFAVIAETRERGTARGRAGQGGARRSRPLPPVLTRATRHTRRHSTCCRRCTWCAATPGGAPIAARAAPAARHAVDRRPGAVLPRRPDQLRDPARGRRHAGALLDAAPDRDASVCRARARHRTRTDVHVRMPSHGRRLRRQGVAVGAVRLRGGDRGARSCKRAVEAAPRPRRRLPRSPAGATASEYDYEVGYDDDGRVLGAEIDHDLATPATRPTCRAR